MRPFFTLIEPKRNVTEKHERIPPAVKRRRVRPSPRKQFVTRATIVNRQSGPVLLKEILSGPFVFNAEDMDHVWCIPIGLAHGGTNFEGALKSVNEFAEKNYRSGRDHLPSLIVLGDLRQISPRNRRRISSELEAAGAIFVDWPKGSSSVQDAFRRVATEMRANY